MKALIISNGDLSDISLAKYFDDADIVICADGGARHLFNEDLVPDTIIGDLDSLDEEALNSFQKLGVNFEKYPTHKDKSDTELAIEFAIDKGATDITLLGATGSRMDHSLANILILYRLVNQNINAVIVDSHNEMFITKSLLKLDNKDGHFVSVIPLTDSKVTLKGFEYDTNSVEFNFGSTLGVSNIIKDEEGLIEIESGICLVIRSRD
ncbi:thiamine diphosphokinase [Proteiniborus sp. MB09-C3]|uniref:thiamine diphosphokinase n=1 Tax=Proteiniborus sp. MB09-C3 TaxID=3050072 RepID=UPI00255624A9|nr:thiamine diphosphokinase [Proteiniborus sp. MB09-C3]WIV10810.1 thiamine diphosphokinase [Proteiniborus sp. MB09-C3]